jgi:excisionase family DNA binding protein
MAGDGTPKSARADHSGRAGAVDGEEELLTVDEVCAWFKVTRAWVYDEVEAGRLPYLRLGRKHLRFRRRELTDYLAAAVRQPAPRARQGSPTGIDAALEPLD